MGVFDRYGYGPVAAIYDELAAFYSRGRIGETTRLPCDVVEPRDRILYAGVGLGQEALAALPSGGIVSGEATMVAARTTEGDIGVLADHEPTMAALATGAVSIHHEGRVTTAGIHGGFLQIYRNQVTLLTDRAELTEGGLEEAREAARALRDVAASDEPEG